MTDTNEGPLSRLMRGMGIDDKLAPIAAIKRIDEMPVKVGTPVSDATASDAICPACALFEIDPGTELCPRCGRIAANRTRHAAERHQHHESVDREVLARRLDEIDPDWHQHFLSTDEAARFYREELK